MKNRRCVQCEQPLAKHVRSDTKFCSPTCRKARHQLRHSTDWALAHPRYCEICRCRIDLVQKRRDTKFCSSACRQRAHRERKAAVKPPRKAHQRVIRRSMRLLPKHYTVVTATVDSLAGEIGTIYQACGFDYVGLMRHQGGRALIRTNGKTISERQAGRLVRTQGARALARLGFDVESVPQRARYFGFRGDKRERARNRAAIAHLITAYPKRMLDAMAMEDRR